MSTFKTLYHYTKYHVKKPKPKLKPVIHCFYNLLKPKLVYNLQRFTYYYICLLKYLHSSFDFSLVNFRTLKRGIQAFAALVKKKPKTNKTKPSSNVTIKNLF